MNPETNKPYETVIMWRVNQLCTFTCTYCDPSLYSLDKNNKYSDKIESFFENTDRTFLLCMTGGEPFLYPNFVELCEKVTKNHYLGIFTNLTVNNVFDFALRVDPQRVEFINCAVHMKEREKRNKVEDFITKFLHLRQKGFNVVATIVGDPIFNKIPLAGPVLRKMKKSLPSKAEH
jgi:organic radical activating enzyme